jgi:preprotein translocase subunit YajC
MTVLPQSASGGGSSALPLLFVILIIGAMYFLMIRPQQRRNRDMQSMQASLGPGDEVMTSSGIYGEVVEIDESDGTILLEISADVVVKFARGAVVRTVAQAQHEALEEEPDDEADADDLAEIEAPAEADQQARPGSPVIEHRKD